MTIDNNAFQLLQQEMAIFIRRAEAARIAYLSEHDCDRSTYLLLQHLKKNGPVGMKALSTSLQLDISTASRQIAALETKGFVERTSDPKDARVSLLQLSDSGSSFLLRAKELRHQFYTLLLEDWSQAECEQFGHLLQKFNQTVEQFRQRKISLLKENGE
ncbi:MarR family winged helix-turn-helix transcriptional regulator [Paenibacillus sp. OV219]|uniref:MarR family winged helix-turn-helix transcriptional regulator n=1 Tax=Paenibacillus sp. OV219 TaxID=1884377 RepID=UPI0008B55839|nr:MarR family transcriptional regulator [Paenibacillus sp. OV219]SEN53638.1 transcriptional regulator, MarR family [Paenibacillus sp. OV219]